MHRKALSLLVTTTVAASLLFGEVWESNALSMRLKPVTGIPDTGYYLVTGNDNESLYLDGALLREKTVIDNGFVIRENGMETVYTLDESGRPLRIESDGIVIQNVYSESGLLLSSTSTGPDGLEVISEYHWSPEGRLQLVEEVDVSYYLPTTRFHYTLEDDTYSINTETPDVFLEKLGETRSKVERLEDESVKLLSHDGSERTYSKDGELIHEIRNGVTYDYVYTDGILSECTESCGKNVTRLYYTDGILSSKEFLVDDTMTRKHLFASDGTLIEERYRNGKPYARVYYDKDHKTIRSIESL